MAAVEDTTESGREAGADSPRRDPDQIAQEIEQTRAELAGSIDAIADRVNPKSLLAEYGPQLAKVGAALAAFMLVTVVVRRRRRR
ncbi:MAG TPA: DUF3618 domain-containing protein [Mycobacteriales bacterium]|nr:DUF3618 domain-containing protein [Mycobacteriales bacterium]